MNSKIKIVFVGTPEFSCPSLKALAEDNFFDIQAVITQPDMPAGRGLILKKSAIKLLAQDLNLPIWQPEKIKLALPQLLALKPDIIVVAAYAQLIPEAILSLPKYGCINIHPSLLPKYRGASPIHAAILNGDTETGTTIMMMEKTLDTGDILNQVKLAIASDETTTTLSSKLSQLSAQILILTLKDLVDNKIMPKPQNNLQASYFGLVKKDDGLINWSDSAEKIERLVRAFSEWPGAWTWFKGQQLKIICVLSAALPIETYKPGKIFVYNNLLAVQCGSQALVIDKLKLAGKQECTGTDFINGHREQLGIILG